MCSLLKLIIHVKIQSFFKIQIMMEAALLPGSKESRQIKSVKSSSKSVKSQIKTLSVIYGANSFIACIKRIKANQIGEIIQESV
jgi:hypothetical protein